MSKSEIKAELSRLMSIINIVGESAGGRRGSDVGEVLGEVVDRLVVCADALSERRDAQEGGAS